MTFRPTHTLAIGAAAALLGGCWHFTGDRGVLGFVTNLRGAPGADWTPEHRVAAGTTVEVTAGRADLEEGPFEVDGAVDGDLVATWATPNGIALTNGNRRAAGRVSFTGDLEDGFDLAFAPAADASLHHVLSPSGADTLGRFDAAFSVVRGSQLEVFVTVDDRRGEALGFAPGDLEVDGTGGIAAWHTGGAVVVDAQDPGPGSLVVSLHGRELARWDVDVVEADAVVDLDLATAEVRDDEGHRHTAVQLVGIGGDGHSIYGLDPDWSWTEGTAEQSPSSDLLVLAGAGGDVTARIGERDVTASVD